MENIPVILIQTSDEGNYSRFLDVTRPTISMYCDRHGIQYYVYRGVKRGFHPWQATFNRIPILNETYQSGLYDWAVYLDADAFVHDLSFNILEYLNSKRNYMLVASRGLNKGKWDVNAGVLFLNMRHKFTGQLIKEWSAAFCEQVSDDLLRTTDRPWGFKPNDQDLLQTILRDNLSDWGDSIFVERKEMINSPSGTFIRQVLRRDAETVEDRINLVASGVAASVRQVAWDDRRD